MTTQWKAVPNYEGLYEVSNDGRVRSLDRTVPHAKGIGGRTLTGMVLSCRGGTDGHRFVVLSKDGYRKNKSVHQLMAEAFIGPRPTGSLVHHIDENPANNNLDNLKYLTYKEHKAMHKNMGSGGLQVTNRKLTREAVEAIRFLKENDFNTTFLSRAFGVTRSNINKIVNGETWVY
jgi:hypothetical protein